MRLPQRQASTSYTVQGSHTDHVGAQQTPTPLRTTWNRQSNDRFNVGGDQDEKPEKNPVMYTRMPRISTFTGSTSKGEAGFEDWKFEIRCLMRDKACHEDLLLQSARTSLKGEASRLAMHLGEHATLEDIIRKLERVYGTVETGTTLLQQFYNCKQEDETIGAYSCRLEDILNKAVRRSCRPKTS